MFIVVLVFLILCYSCKKESSRKTTLALGGQSSENFNTQKIPESTSVQFKVMKTEVVGLAPIQIFYWICLREQVKTLSFIHNDKV